MMLPRPFQGLKVILPSGRPAIVESYTESSEVVRLIYADGEPRTNPNEHRVNLTIGTFMALAQPFHVKQS